MRSSRRPPTGLVLLFLVGFACIGGCRRDDGDENRQEDPERWVIVAPVGKRDIVKVLHLTGTLAAAQEVDITSKMPGRVATVLVEEGSPVKAGDALIELEREELALAVAQAEAAVAVAEAGLARVLAGTRKEQIEQAAAAAAQAKANSDLCKVTFERAAKLIADESIPRTRYDEAKARYDVAVAQQRAALAALEMARIGPTQEDIAIARAQVVQAKTALASASRQHQNATIASPIDGVVVHKNVEPGEVVSPPMVPGPPLLRIAHTKTLRTKVRVSENRVNAVRLGQEATIALDGFPGEIFPGEVSKISPVVDPRSRTFEAEIVIPNPDRRLKPGMFARVRLVLAKRVDVVKVPLAAVVEGEKGPVVFLAANGVARARPVTLGISDGVDVEVLSGVKVGEAVAVRGNVGLKDGDKIVVKPRRANE